MKNAMQLKAIMKKLAKENQISAQLVLQNYMLERFLERVSLSPYRDNYIIKGGFLISSMVGLNSRATMDMDATIKGYPVTQDAVQKMIEQILTVPVDDDITFTFKSIGEIREGDEYTGYRVALTADFPPMAVPLKLDITTGDKITPREIQYDYKLMLEDRHIQVMAYNLATILAEKLETVISRSDQNTRPRDYYDVYVANMKLYFASAAITYSLKFLLSSGIKKIHKPMVASSASIKWAPLTIGFPLISLVGISICYYLSMNGKIAAAFVLFSSGILLATNAVILILIDLTEKNNLAQEQQKMLNEQLRSQRANIDALSSAYATQRKMTHDFRHHIAALSGMLQGGETQQAQDYLAALQEQQTERALMVNTHNSAIDAVLNQKGYAAQKQHIDIQFEVNDLSPLQIELIDCTVVLGNLLDNAIEACLKLEEAKRRIEVSVLRDEAYADGDAKLYVSIINTSLPVHIEKDCIATTKLEPHLHGFGLPCAKELLRRNNAFYTMDYHDGAFQFCFEWPDVACNSCVHA